MSGIIHGRTTMGWSRQNSFGQKRTGVDYCSGLGLAALWVNKLRWSYQAISAARRRRRILGSDNGPPVMHLLGRWAQISVNGQKSERGGSLRVNAMLLPTEVKLARSCRGADGRVYTRTATAFEAKASNCTPAPTGGVGPPAGGGRFPGDTKSVSIRVALLGNVHITARNKSLRLGERKCDQTRHPLSGFATQLISTRNGQQTGSRGATDSFATAASVAQFRPPPPPPVRLSELRRSTPIARDVHAYAEAERKSVDTADSASANVSATKSRSRPAAGDRKSSGGPDSGRLCRSLLF